MPLLILILLGGLLFLVVGAIRGLMAFARVEALELRIAEQDALLRLLRARLRDGPPPVAGSAPSTPPMPAAAEAADVRGPGPVAIDVPTPPTNRIPAPLPPPVAPAPAPDQVVGPSPVSSGSRTLRRVVATAPARDAGDITGIEATVGMRWLTWCGVGMLFLGLVFFLKYAYDQDWLGRYVTPPIRIATVVAVALAMLGLGWRQWRLGAAALGQGLMGGGQALLYLAVFAAFQPAMMVVREPLIGATAAFALMALVTAGGLGLAVGIDALAMAIIAVLGGFLTPVLVGSGEDAREVLFAYLLLLDLGVLGVALYRRWRWLDLLAFAGTFLLFAGWFAAWYHQHLPHPDTATLVWLGVFHVVFLLLPFAHHWRHHTPVTVERFALALANLAWSLGYGAHMLQDQARMLLALLCLGSAAAYLGIGVMTFRCCGEDRRTLHGFTALATMLLTLGLFYLLPVDGITTAWFAEAAILLHLGHRFAYGPSRWAALAVLALALGRTAVLHLPHSDHAAAFIVNRWMLIELVAVTGLAAFALVHARHRATGPDRQVALGTGVTAGLWLLLTGVLEILRHAQGRDAAWQAVLPVQAIAWWSLAVAAGFLVWAQRWRERAALGASFLPLVVAAIAAANAYDHYAGGAWLALNTWAMTGLATGLMATWASWTAWHRCADPRLGAVLAGSAQLLFVILLTVECMAWIQQAPHAPEIPGRVLAWVWIVAALASSLVAMAWRSRRILIIGFLPLVGGLVAVLVLYDRPWPGQVLVANSRFLLGMIAACGVAWYGQVRRRLAEDGPLPATARLAAGAALAFALLIATCEAVAWSGQHAGPGHPGEAWTALLLGLFWLAGSALGWWRHRRSADPVLLLVGVLALAGGTIAALVLFAQDWPAAWMFVNLRFLLAGLAVAMLTAYGRVGPRLRPLGWVAYGVGLLALTCEPPVWLLANVADHREAVKAATFSVTVVWVLSAVVSLVVGFRHDRRLLRITALGLFALTAAKLLIMDMGGAQQLYRIIAFLVVGAVFVTASWLYHQAERRLAQRRRERAVPAGPAQNV